MYRGSDNLQRACVVSVASTLVAVVLTACAGSGGPSSAPQPGGSEPITGTFAGFPTGPGTGIGAGTTATAPYEPTTGCYTLTLTGTDLWAISRLPSQDGPPTPIQTYQTADLFTSSLTWFDGYWWICQGRMVSLDPNTGQVRQTDNLCGLLLEIEGELVVQPQLGNDLWHRYPSSAAAHAGDLAESSMHDWGSPWVATAIGTTMYGIQGAGPTVRVTETPRDTWTTLDLDGFDAPISGISDTQGVLRVQDDGRQAGADLQILVRDFDPVSGAELGRIAIGTFGYQTYAGLWCTDP